MRVLALNYSDISGGAGRAAYRIHHALRQHGIDSTMLVNHASAGDWTARGPQGKLNKAIAKLRLPLGELITKPLRIGNPGLHSLSVLHSAWAKMLNRSDADVVNLHWVNAEMMSISDLGRIRKPIVWTLHDMWAFCGAEHYTEDTRWRDGYTRASRPACEGGFDLNRWTWLRKRKAWERPMHIVTPSAWLAECVRQSKLMGGWPVWAIPNPIDTNIWQPVDKKLARQLLQLPSNVPLLLFGALGGVIDPRKGFDMLKAALELLRGQIHDLELVVFGQLSPETPVDLGFPVHYMGQLHDDVVLRLLYSAADALVIPSRQDNLPNTGVESLACGTPVVAFHIGGLPDIVTHHITGYLARAFDVADLAQGIQWVLANCCSSDFMCTACREKAVRDFSVDVVARQYVCVLKEAMES